LVNGFQYTRAGTFRVTKGWELASKKKVYLAFSVENPEVVSTGTSPTGFTIFGLQNSASGNPGAAGSNCAVDRTVAALAPCSTFASGLSIDAAPDIIGKVAIEPGWGHFEIAGIGRFFRDRIVTPAASAAALITANSNAGSNHTTPGGGVSFNAVLPVAPKKVDIVLATLAGRGVGRYVGAPDVTFRPDGRLEPMLTGSAYAGVETHPSPKLDVNVYFGDVYIKRNTYITGGTALLPTGTGYALVSSDLRACNEEIPVTGQACAANNKNIYEIAPGFWYRFYRGPAGTLQFGAYYSYYYRSTWAGRVTATGAGPLPIHASESEILTSFRWYFP
jgi:hypothetical protein